ncbi:Uncharacterised protein [Mycobacteroides abscessus subsp. abscessus]|uniref:hypothetical protein n=1 Tax=Mycobacteroides abscessus TaxID=36809 RepID=UPI0009A7B99E|nr:hypothetical protein [Mycobacteroides abscessus]SLJ23810.1 Uncharacterised protein [Mycobacteroides abscessus subsp. abscessus]
MSNATETRPVIRASVSDIALTAEFLSLLFDAPVVITSAHNEVSTPGERHLVMIVAETSPMGDAA